MSSPSPSAAQVHASFPVNLVNSFANTPYDHLGAHRAIRERRDELGGLLFIDKLAAELLHLPHKGQPQASGSSPPAESLLPQLSWDSWKQMYPPQNLASLVKLIEIIESRVRKDINKISLIYYILLDYPASFTAGDSLPKYYADETDLPEGYRHLIKGLHLMDSFHFEKGLTHLCQPSVVPTYPEQVVSAFVKSHTKRLRRHHKPTSNGGTSIHTSNVITSSLSSSNNHSILSSLPLATLHTGYSLAIAFIAAKSPTLVDGCLIEAYVSVLCKVSINTALDFVRSVSDIESPEIDESPFYDDSFNDDSFYYKPENVSSKAKLLRVIVDSTLKQNASSHVSNGSVNVSSSFNNNNNSSNGTSNKIPLNGASSASSTFKPTRPHKNPIRGIFKSSPAAWRFANMPFSYSESAIVETVLMNIIESGNFGHSSGTNEYQDNDTSMKEDYGSSVGKSTYDSQQISMAKDILLLRALHTGNTHLATKLSSLPLVSIPVVTNGVANLKFKETGDSTAEGTAPNWKDVAKGISLWHGGR